ncbi:MAG: hypothetical protein ACFFDH_11645 [Promethearchaeota archaeon]
MFIFERSESIIIKCQSCEELKPTTNVQDEFPLIFISDNSPSSYSICEDCKRKLVKYGFLISKDGKCTAFIQT